jgi:hypothetical protein
MEAIAARTTGGTYLVAIERDKAGNVGRLDLHFSLVPGERTDAIREVLGEVAAILELEGERDLMARLAALVSELHAQDRARA